MENLMSSLLVYNNGQLIPAASEKEGNAACTRRLVRKKSANSEQVRTREVEARAAPMANMFAENAHAARDHKRQRRSYSPAGIENQSLSNSTAPPCIGPIAGQSKLDGTTARRSANTTSSLQDAKPSAEANNSNEHSLPSSNQMEFFTAGLTQGGNRMDFGTVNLVSMDDWEIQNPYTPPPPKAAKPPRPTALPLKLQSNDGSSTSMLYQLCQAKGLKLEIRTREAALACFTASLFINGIEGEKSELQYASKQDAREAICKLNLAWVSGLEDRKRQKSDQMDDLSAPEPDDLDDEEWMGILIHYVQTNKLSRPEITAKPMMPPNVGPWYCELRMPDGPSQPFGYGSGPFKTKKTAEKAAAKEAVSWLRSNGKLAEGFQFHNPTKGKRKPASPPTLAEGTVSLAQKTPKERDGTTSPQEDTAGMQIQRLALELNITPPSFRSETLEGPFVNGWAEFLPKDARYEPRVAGQVCRVPHVFGKKAAKEEVWREVLRLLEEIKKDRMAAWTNELLLYFFGS